MTTKEVAQICGVTDRTVSGNAQKAGVVLENGKSHDWAEEELKRLQLVLMKNSVSAGGQKTEESIVKENLESTFEVGLVANENGLKQDPIYGKLGKIQLDNGEWVNQFFHNEDALTVMESVIG